jgi:hypothetical protein
MGKREGGVGKECRGDPWRPRGVSRGLWVQMYKRGGDLCAAA